MKDGFKREIDYLRISLTDKCNLRCTYCMPKEGLPNLAQSELLTDDEIVAIVESFARLGVKKIKLTGGEPLIRPHIEQLVKRIKDVLGIEMVTLTTNGVLLEQKIEQLAKAGLDSVNISLDTLNREKFSEITRRDVYDRVMQGIQAVCRMPHISLKLNVVLAKELNGEELIDLVELAHHEQIHVRFIELMPFGYAKDLTPISSDEVIALLQKRYHKVEKVEEILGNGPAVYYKLPEFVGRIGFISAMSHTFCSRCNRVRLTAVGGLKTCLHYKSALNLKPYIQTDELDAVIAKACQLKQEQHQFLEEKLTDELENKSMAQIGG